MYKIPTQFVIPKEVEDFHNDCDNLGMINDMDNWYITTEWQFKFKQHLDKLLVLAELGDPWAQYNVGQLYSGGYIYSDEEEFKENYVSDVTIASKWLEKSARQGFVIAPALFETVWQRAYGNIS